MSRTIIFFVFLFAGIKILSGQTQLEDSVRLLPEVAVKAGKLHQSAAFVHQIKADSLIINDFFNKNLGDLLLVFGAANIKSYGQGGLISVNSRGTSAAQTAVNWNGFNINSPMNGQADLSQIPLFLADEIHLQYGGVSSVWGSGSVGGTININNLMPADTVNTVRFSKEVGSFGLNKTTVKAGAVWNTGAIVVRAFNHSSENNFEFRNITKPGAPSEVQQNAGWEQTGIMPELYLSLGKKHNLSIKTWMQNNAQELPNTMLTSDNNEKQFDKICRSMFVWKYKQADNYFSIKAGNFIHKSLYVSDLIKDTSKHKAVSNVFESEAGLNVRTNINLQLSVSYTSESVASSDYSRIAARNNISTNAFISWDLTKYSASLFANSRLEHSTGNVSPLTYSLGIKKKIYRSVFFNASASRNFRQPSFNDLYWIPGGNNKLKPENGYSQEAGFSWKSNTSVFQTLASMHFYNSNVRNRIVWLPDGNFWSARNFSEVWCRGAEISTFSKIIFNNNLSAGFRLAGSYNKATSAKKDLLENQLAGSQLIYVPFVVTNSSLSIVWKKTSVSFYRHYTGKRFTTSDNSTFIKPYDYSAFILNHTLGVKQFKISCFFGIYNLFNAEYQITEWRPMPPINFSIGASLSFNN